MAVYSVGLMRGGGRVIPVVTRSEIMAPILTPTAIGTLAMMACGLTTASMVAVAATGTTLHTDVTTTPGRTNSTIITVTIPMPR